MLETAIKLGLSELEYNRIVELLGRAPNYTELGIFSVMWSEHCSYKSSLNHLKRFPTHSDRALTEMGEENAGVLRLKGKWAVAFKIESHNHPSAIEPFQGAATGVGGILRDVFTMGAYPIASLNSLRFGELSDPLTKHLFDGVIRGIAFYGNCFGVPTVAGEVYFDSAYLGNPLVNVVAVGIIDTSKMISAMAAGIGNPVVYIGSSTGRDGIHGASFASVELTEKSHEDRPSVQIGAPFTEKSVLEATQEIAAQHLAVGMQDMGAAGLTSSSSEMAAKGNVGIEMDLNKVPMREENMTPYEIMLSESQERMLLISTHENLPKIEAILEKWELHYAVIGKVIEEQVLRVLWNGEIAADIPVNTLKAGDGAPVYDLPQEKPDWLDDLNKRNPVDELKAKLQYENSTVQEILPQVLSIPTIASKRWVWRQYDHQVGIRTAVLPGAGDAAIMRVMETGQFVALCTDCSGAFTYLDPYIGGALSVLESASNVAACGAKPIGITDCLNFGNPQKPAVMWQFASACDGISDACRTLAIPVTGGNVSFYNESPVSAVFPSPVIGMVGLIEEEKHITPLAFQNAGDAVFILGETNGDEIGGSQLQKLFHGEYFGRPPAANIERSVGTIELLLGLIHDGEIRSAHDISEGGIGVALAECAIASENLGAKIELSDGDNFEQIIWLFSESTGRFIITTSPENAPVVTKTAAEKNIPLQKIGSVIREPELIVGNCVWNIDELENIYESVLPDAMKN